MHRTDCQGRSTFDQRSEDNTVHRLAVTFSRPRGRSCHSSSRAILPCASTRFASKLFVFFWEPTLTFSDVDSSGRDLPVTELQPADDFALLAAQAYISAWSKSCKCASFLVATTLILETFFSKLQMIGPTSRRLRSYSTLLSRTVATSIKSESSSFSLYACSERRRWRWRITNYWE